MEEEQDEVQLQKIKEEHFKEALESRGFDMISQIGHGGFASVYLITSRQYEKMKFVAKIIDLSRSDKNGLPDSFESEIYALTQLIHPNIISIFDHFTYADGLYLILEYCSGGTVTDLLKAYGPIQPPQLYQISFEILLALNFCQNRGIAHRDIKPSNIFIDKYGRSKLADFGFATMNERLSETYAGSLPFMPLEILHLSPYDPMKADIWSLGVTFYLMATGTLPYLPKSANNLAMLIATREPDYPDIVDPEFAEIIKSMLKVNPADRTTPTAILETPLFKRVEESTRIHRRSLNRKGRRVSSTASTGSVIGIPKVCSVGSMNFLGPKICSPVINKMKMRTSVLQATFSESPDCNY